MPANSAAELSQDDYTQRAIYETPANAFTSGLPQVPKHIFVAERDKAFDPATGTAFIALDLGERLGADYPATTPNLLARYARLTKGETLTANWMASGEAHYVMKGNVTFRKGDDEIRASEGDVVVLPGGGETRLTGGDADSLVFLVTDEPLIAHLGVEPPTPGRAKFKPVHYLADVTMEKLVGTHDRDVDGPQTGKAVVFCSPETYDIKTVTPSVFFSLNSLPPGADQDAHRHNAVAITLAVACEGVYSMIEDERVDWQEGAVMITPPLEKHSHHNRGSKTMLGMIAQDGGLFYHSRAVGFSFD